MTMTIPLKQVVSGFNLQCSLLFQEFSKMQNRQKLVSRHYTFVNDNCFSLLMHVRKSFESQLNFYTIA